MDGIPVEVEGLAALKLLHLKRHARYDVLVLRNSLPLTAVDLGLPAERRTPAFQHLAAGAAFMAY